MHWKLWAEFIFNDGFSLIIFEAFACRTHDLTTQNLNTHEENQKRERKNQ